MTPVYQYSVTQVCQYSVTQVYQYSVTPVYQYRVTPVYQSMLLGGFRRGNTPTAATEPNAAVTLTMVQVQITLIVLFNGSARR